MGRFDLHDHPSDEGFLLDVQTDLIRHLNTRIVVPLLPPGQAPVPARRLNPSFVIGSADYVMVTQFLAAISASELSTRRGNLSRYQDEITAALDMIFQGF